MNYEQKSCDSFRLCDFFVSLSRQMKNQYIFRVMHIQCPGRFRPDGERERERGREGVVRGGAVGVGVRSPVRLS